MTFLYDARCSVVLLRPKNEVKLATQSVDKWIFYLWGNGPYQLGGFYFSGFRKAQEVQMFSEASFAANAIPEKIKLDLC